MPTVRKAASNCLDLATGQNVHHPLAGRPGFFAETGDPGVLVIGLERRLVLYDVVRACITGTLGHIPEDERVIINDGIAIPGGLIFGIEWSVGTSSGAGQGPVMARTYPPRTPRDARAMGGLSVIAIVCG